MKTFKKVLSLFWASLFVFTGICALADSETNNTYYFEGFNNLETDEIEYLFNAKCVILPENYKPEVKVFYDGVIDGFVLPDYITLVFVDGTSVKCSPDNPPVLDDGEPLLIRYITDLPDEEGCFFAVEIYRELAENSSYYPHTSVLINCNKVEKSLGENVTYLFNKIVSIIKEFFKS
ncbi:MAG: hypothetical protein IK085_06290, partial [Clostridia bacterium]|nr:hypothetical protein [Clostridia bacterium]